MVKGQKPLREAHCPPGLAGREAAIHKRPLLLPEKAIGTSIGRSGVVIDRTLGVVIHRNPGVAMIRGQLALSTIRR